MNKLKYIESLIKQLYYYEDKIKQLEEQIEDTWHSYFGAKSPPLSPVYGTGEDRQSKLVRIGYDKVKPLEEELEYIRGVKERIEKELKLNELEPNSLKLIELYYKRELRQEEIARIMNYSNKSSISRKVRRVLKEIEGRF